jgi:hypothetical protein
MADTYTVEYQKHDGDGQYEPAPEGPQQVVCVDGIFLGEKVEMFPGSPAKLVKKYALVFQTADFNPATGRRFEIQKEFTVSMHERAALRKFLGNWRGKQYTDEEAAKVELHKVVGVNGLATVEHKTSQAGRKYAVVTNITPLVRGMTKIDPSDYTRAPFWEDRKAEYARDVAAHKRATANGEYVPASSAAQQQVAAADAQSRPQGVVNTPGRVEDAFKQAEKTGASAAATLDAAFDGDDASLPF